MLFRKEKMYLGSFCRSICSDIIQIPSLSYQDFLKSNENNQIILTKEEYEAFNNQLSNYRLLVLYSGVLQKSLDGKIKYTNEEINKIFVQALQLTYEDNKYSKDVISAMVNSFAREMKNFSNYLQTVDKEKINKYELIVHVSMYFTTKFVIFNNTKNDANKRSTFTALTNNNRKITKDYFEKVFKKVNILDSKINEQSNIKVNENIEFSFEFNQFLSKIKTNYDQQPEKLSDHLLIISLTAFCARFFYICDDRQFYLIKSYLLDLFSSEFKTKDELYNLGVPENIFSLIFKSLTENEQNAVINLFGKGDLFPFKSAPVLCFGKDAYEDNDKPFITYQFRIEVKNNSATYNLKMPSLNPTKIFIPLALGYMIKFVYDNFKQNESFAKSKQVLLDMLALINDNNFSERNLVNGVLIKNKIVLVAPKNETRYY